jgi:hypothetical protein
VNTAAFLIRYPEFGPIDPTLIVAVLTEVGTELNPTLYPTNYDAAQGALTAHRIFVSPAGLSLRGETDKLDTSDYLKMFKQMAQGSVVVSCPRRGW